MTPESTSDRLSQVSEDVRNEIALVQSMYPGQFQWSDDFHQPSSQALSFRLSLNPNFQDGLERRLTIRLNISPDYPSKSAPSLSITSDELNREDEKQLNELYQSWINSKDYLDDRPTKGEICLDILINKVSELACGFSPLKKSQQTVKEQHSLDSSKVGEDPPKLQYLDMAWSVFWMHHIMATGKRKNIVAWGRELQIRGWSKPGYPGVVIIDGPKKSVEEYSSRLKALRWKAIQQRHFEEYLVSLTPDGFPTGVEEKERKIKKLEEQDGVVEVESMSELLACARSSGLEAEVLEILKIK